MELTHRQQEIFDFILEYLEENHSVPTGADIADHFGVYPNAIHEQLVYIMKKDAIEYVPNTRNGRYRLCNYQVKATKCES